jgi:hypothetical protein
MQSFFQRRIFVLSKVRPALFEILGLNYAYKKYNILSSGSNWKTFSYQLFFSFSHCRLAISSKKPWHLSVLYERCDRTVKIRQFWWWWQNFLCQLYVRHKVYLLYRAKKTDVQRVSNQQAMCGVMWDCTHVKVTVCIKIMLEQGTGIKDNHWETYLKVPTKSNW